MRQTTANGKEKTSDRGNCNNNIKRDRGKNNKKRLKKIKYNIKTVVLFRWLLYDIKNDFREQSSPARCALSCTATAHAESLGGLRG